MRFHLLSVILALSLPSTLARAQSTAGAQGTIAASAGAVGTIHAPSPAGSPGMSPSAAPATSPVGDPKSTTPSVEGTAAATYPLTEKDKKTLLSEYNRAQANEEKALRHLQRSQMKELTAAQSQRVRTWHEEQKNARRDFFDKHLSGPERREYVQGYIQRKKDFDQSVKVEYDTARKSWAEKVEQLKTRQKEQRKKFKASLDQGKRPDATLWPSGN